MSEEVRLDVKASGRVEVYFEDRETRALVANNVPGVRRVRGDAQRIWTWWPFLIDIRKELKDFKHDIRWTAPGYSQKMLKALAYERKMLVGLKKPGGGDLDYSPVWDRAFRKPYVPWLHQHTAAEFMVRAKRVLLADDVGLGKTLSTVAAFLMLLERDEAKSMLVVTSASAKWQWRTEIRAMVNSNYLPLKNRIAVIDGSPKQREQQWRARGSLFRIVNYETLLRDSEILSELLAQKDIDVVVLDEGSRIKNRGTKISKLIRKLVQKHDVPYRYILNATPLENKLEELWSLFDFLRPETFMSFTAFSKHYLVEEMVYLCWRCRRPYPVTTPPCPNCKAHPQRRMRKFPKTTGAKNIPRLLSRIAPVSLRRQAGDLGWDVPTVSTVLYWIDLDRDQRREYDAIKRADGNPLGKQVKCRMATLMLSDNPTDSPTPKTRELIRLLKEEMVGEKVLVFTESRQYIDVLVRQLGDAGIEGVGWIHGGVKTKDREIVRESLNEGGTRVLLLDAAGEHALNLQAAPIVVNLDLPWNPARIQQRVGRVRPYLGGKDRFIRVINILAKDTVEERVVAAIEKKLGLFSRVWGEHDVDLTGVFSADNMEAML